MHSNYDSGWLPLPSRQDGFDIVEFVEGGHGGEVVDVDVEDLIAELSENRVIELEERELYPLCTVGDSREVLGHLVVTVAVHFFKMCENLIGTFHNRLRHTGELRNMDTETVFASTAREFAEKYNLTVDFTHGYIEIHHAAETLLHLVKLVVMSGKQCLRMG